MIYEKEKILDIPICRHGIGGCIKNIISWLKSYEYPKFFVCANPHSLIIAETDPFFKESIHSADLVTPDGVGILLASRFLGGQIRGRVTGSDMFFGLSQALNEKKKYSYFFLGSTQQTLDAIKEKLAVDYPDIRIAGSYSPPYKLEFSEQDSRKMIEAVNAAGTDILWVGMTAPKQEKWIHQYRDQLDVKFIGAIGAVFDFYVGNVKRSHPIFQQVGLEWLPRLIREPRRLWRRNFISTPLFMLRVVSARLKGERARPTRD